MNSHYVYVFNVYPYYVMNVFLNVH